MKQSLFIVGLFLFIIVLSGCMIGNTPSNRVEKVLNMYQNNASSIEMELDDYLKTLNLDDEFYNDYKNIYLKQYQDLKYKIVDEKIEGDKATVIIEVTVYDYYKIENDVSMYITNNPNEFMDNGKYSDRKALVYKIDKLSTAKDRVDHLINFNLTKVDDTWSVDELSNEDLEKIHGVYAH